MKFDKEKPFEFLFKAKAEGKRVVVITGAGVSTDSGLPDFRSKEGLWRGKNPADVASVEAMEDNYEEFLEFYTERYQLLQMCNPNRNHEIIGKLTELGFISTVITQNIDMFHRPYHKDSNLIELHGALEFVSDNGKIRPNVVLYGEDIKEHVLIRAYTELLDADIVVAIGTSLTVNPMRALVQEVMLRGVELVILNNEATALDSDAHLIYHSDINNILEPVAEQVNVAELG
ncbi:NAD-dependent protein deacetylase [Exiguobacterium phage vB_EalM-132]|nr:NAD-dependent protein deacetylase [Exiguobacterium phage vB_EalM-132]